MTEEKKKPISIFPLIPGRPRIVPEKPEQRKAGPAGLGIIEELPRPLREIRKMREGRRGER